MGLTTSQIADISPVSGESPASSNLYPRGALNGGRYNVLGMLGRGATSTVWLAQDNSSPRLVAIKLVAADLSGVSHERDIRQLLGNAAPSHAGYKHVQHMMDSFVEHGWFYLHQCFVGTPAGAFSLASSKEASDGVNLFPLDVSRAMTAQLILAVGFIHSRGVVHGDIHLGNILVALPPRAMKTESSPSSSWLSSILPTGSASDPSLDDFLDTPSHELALRDAHILLTDFGDAWQPATEDRHALRTPYIARAPEAFFTAPQREPLTSGSDMWALACALFAIYARRTLFELFLDVDAAAVLGEVVSALGPPPAAWLDTWTGAPIAPLEVFPLARRVEEVRTSRAECARWFADDEPAVDDGEVAAVEEMLASMLRWEPRDRATAAQVAQGHWMTVWGRPAMERVEKAQASERSS